MLNVMVVDDEQLIRQGLVKILSKYPGNLAIAGAYANGVEAMVHLSGLKPDEIDVLIADIEMPMMDGLKLTQQAKAKLPHLSIIMLSGYKEFEYARDSLRSGAMDYLLKPVDKVELFRLLEKCEKEKAELRKLEGADGEHHRPAEHAEAQSISQQVRLLLEKEYGQDRDLEYIARKVGFNASYISKLFSRDMGETITDCLNRIRMEKSKQFLIDHPGLKVYEIAYLVGYRDKIYFQKLFKRMFGITPMEYRESITCKEER